MDEEAAPPKARCDRGHVGGKWWLVAGALLLGLAPSGARADVPPSSDKRRGAGCGGCSVGATQGEGPAGAVLLAGALALARRRRRR